MKRIIFLLICTSLSFASKAQSFIGAWEKETTSANGEPIKNVVIFSDGFQVSTWFHAKTGEFLKTNGGTWKLVDNTMTEKVEFDSNNPERVGTEVRFQVNIIDTTMEIEGDALRWHRIDSGQPGELQGAWLMSGRIQNGKTEVRDTAKPRKTMKILSGTRFQWIAYNTETKEFMGTGGGSYTTINGKYTENIEFFSRDNSRVGRSLEFDYRLIDGNWHHSGLSSKGDPIHEIWSLRKE
jgi:hypothetical protein